jgi:ribose 5-phosphate isomerase B
VIEHGLILALQFEALLQDRLTTVIRRVGSHSGKRIYFGYDRYVLPELSVYIAALEAHGKVVLSVDETYLHYLTSAELVCTAVQRDPDSVGVLICGTGMGMSIAANKFKDVYAARCISVEDAESCRMINNANVLCLGAKFGLELNTAILDMFARTPYRGRKIEELEYITNFENPQALAPIASPLRAARRTG